MTVTESVPNGVASGHQRPLRELVKTAKALHSKMEQSIGKTEQLQITLGLTLAEAKVRNKTEKGPPWADFVKKHFNFGYSRADELIRIGTGATTVEATRETKRVSMARTRSKSPPHGGDPDRPKLSEFTDSNGVVKPACEFNGEDPVDVAEPGDTPEMISHRIFMHHASEASRHARESGFETVVINKEAIAAALQAAEAWSELTSRLQRRSAEGT